MTKPEVLRPEEEFYVRVLRKGLPGEYGQCHWTIPTINATARLLLCLFLIIFIKPSDTAKHNLAEIISPAAKIMLTKYAALKLNIYRKKSEYLEEYMDNILHEYYFLY